MYILTVSKDKQATAELKQILGTFFESRSLLVSGTHSESARLINDKQISLAFIEVTDISDIELASKIIKKNPVANIIFFSDTRDYAYDAFEVFASGYIVKPITADKVARNLDHLRFQIDRSGKKRLEVRCFGKFEVFAGGEAVRFARGRTKELLAYLVDRNGSLCNSDDLLGILWPDDPPTKSLKQQLRNLIYDLKRGLSRIDAWDVIIRRSNEIGIDKDKIKCDFYDFLKGDPKALQSFSGEYMTQYSEWSCIMEMNLQKYFYEE